MNGASAAEEEPLTVLMPVRNGANFLHLSLADIAAGLSVDDELLVIDDGSDDTTPDVLAAWTERDARLRCISLPPSGLADALNIGVMESSNEWIARADVDDRYPESRFRIQRAVRAEGVAAIVGDYSIANSGSKLGTIPCALGHPFVALSALNPQRIPHPGTMFRRSAVLAAGGYLPDEFPAEDLGLWLRLMQVGTFVGVPHTVVKWRLASGSTSASRQAEQRALTRDLLNRFPMSIAKAINEDQIAAELDRYKKVSLGAHRGVLLGRDLLTARRRGARVPLRGFVRAAMSRPIALARATGTLGLEARQRGRVRQTAT